MKTLPALIALTLSMTWSAAAVPHAALEKSVPAAGTVLNAAPEAVTLTFDSDLETAFSNLTITDSQGEKVGENNRHALSRTRKTLVAAITTKASGVYHVHWDVVSRDGHRARGDFTFTVK